MVAAKPNSPVLEDDLTQLLVSVRNAKEAQTVSPDVVAILDVKEPDRGPLGAPDPQTLRQISQVAAEDQIMSFAAGELSQWQPSIRGSNGNEFDSRFGDLLHEFRYVKVGLAGMAIRKNWQLDWQTMFGRLPAGTSAVAVAYLDYRICNAPPPDDLVAFAATEPNCFTILFDTYDKSSNLFTHVTQAELASLVNHSKSKGLQTVVAGSVNRSILPQAVSVRPDYIGVRGAVCPGGRANPIDGSSINELALTLQALSET